jgi:formylglycine-generating enzyme required for sulfatase activity
MDVSPPSVDSGVDPESWVLVPAGEFYMGQHSHETMVDYAYEVMVTDVTNAQYAQYLNEAFNVGSVKIVDDQVVGYYEGDEFHAQEHEEEIPAGDYIHIPLTDEGLRLNFDGQNYSSKVGYENHPMVLVSWFGAKAYCEFFGWRLPSEIEWEKAARGSDGRPFPWGANISPENANYYSSHDIFEKIWGGAGGTTPVGFYNGKTYDGFQTLDSPSPYGLYDMAGNVWQWTGDVYDDQHYRYMRGGSKENYEYNLRVWTRNSAGPTYYSPSVSFRCVRDQ